MTAVRLGVRQRRTRMHAVVLGQRADVVLLRLLELVEAGQRPATIRPVQFKMAVITTSPLLLIIQLVFIAVPTVN